MMSVARGLANMITDGQQIVGFPSWFSMLAYSRLGGFLTLTVAIMLVVFVLGWAYLRYSAGGCSLLRHRRQPRGVWPASMSTPSRSASMSFRAFWPVLRASCWRCGLTRCSHGGRLV